MDEYPPNSGRAAQAHSAASTEPRPVEQVTQAQVNVKKPGVGQKFKDTFISGDAKTTIGFVFASVIMPQVKDLMVDSVTQGFERLVYGESRGGRRPPGGVSIFGGSPAPQRIPYGQHYSSPTQQGRGPAPQHRQMTPQARQNHDFGQIEVQTHEDARLVLEGLYTLFGQYDVVTVADLYGLTGIAANHTDRQWGWTDLRGSSPKRTRSGTYVLDLPRPAWLGQ